MTEQDIRRLTQLIEAERGFVNAVLGEVRKVIVGQQALIERLLIGLLTRGHLLIEGVPGLAKPLLVQSLADRLAEIGLGGFMEIGTPGQQVLGLQPSEGRLGSVMIGGLNPIAILEEEGHRVLSFALAGLLEYHRLFHFEELPKRLQDFL